MTPRNNAGTAIIARTHDQDEGMQTEVRRVELGLFTFRTW